MAKKRPVRLDVRAMAFEELEECGIGKDPLAIFSFTRIRAELEWLRERLELPPPPDSPPDITAAKWKALMTGLLQSLPLMLETDTAIPWAQRCTPAQLAALSAQVQRATAAVEYAERYQDEYSAATGTLLPTALPQRLLLLLGYAELPLVWMRRLDVLRF